MSKHTDKRYVFSDEIQNSADEEHNEAVKTTNQMINLFFWFRGCTEKEKRNLLIKANTDV